MSLARGLYEGRYGTDSLLRYAQCNARQGPRARDCVRGRTTAAHRRGKTRDEVSLPCPQPIRPTCGERYLIIGRVQDRARFYRSRLRVLVCVALQRKWSAAARVHPLLWICNVNSSVKRQHSRDGRKLLRSLKSLWGNAFSPVEDRGGFANIGGVARRFRSARSAAITGDLDGRR